MKDPPIRVSMELGRKRIAVREMLSDGRAGEFDGVACAVGIRGGRYERRGAQLIAMDRKASTIEPAGAAGDREGRILEHLPQVRLIASRIHEKLPESVSLDDLVSAGTLGLIKAVDHFDASLKVKLKTYAEHRIRGAILDSLRSLDWAPRNKRRKSKQIERAIVEQEKALHRCPTEEEVAMQLGLSLAEYRRWLVEIRGINLAPMEQGATGDGEGSNVLRFVSDNDEHWPSAQFERAELRRLVASTIERLPEVERTIVTLYYRKELTLREIAKVVSLHETRVSQLKSQAILRLRAALISRWPD